MARHAMATRFELVLHGLDPVRLRAIAEEALDEIDRIENLLSRYRPSTDIGRINRGAAHSPTRVTPETFNLLKRARELSKFTDGAFDPTAGPLIQVWGFCEGSGRTPKPEELQQARNCVGWHQIELDEESYSVRFAQAGMALDLGAIGKGYGLDRAAELIREAGVEAALLHGGTSTVVAIGQPPDRAAWNVALATHLKKDPSDGALTEITLLDQSLSVSASWGKCFVDATGRQRGHVLDPRVGEPTAVSGMAAVVAPWGLDSDALSTALLVGGPAMAQKLKNLSDVKCWFRAG